MIEYRDKLAMEYGLYMVYGENREALENHETFPDGKCSRVECCRRLKTEALTHTLDGTWPRYRLNLQTGKYERDTNTDAYTGVIVGARADEEGSRSKERYFSPARQAQRLGSGRPAARVLEPVQNRLCSRHACAHPPLLDWTELNVWEYIEREHIPTVSLYYNQGDGTRYRSLGCAPCTKPIRSESRNVHEIIEELRTGALSNIAERSGRAQDAEDGGGLRNASPGRVHVMEETRNVWENEELLNIVTVGHVDHGKSTVIGRLLADAGALPKGKLESIRENCRRNSKPFEYAFLLDALHNEQDQGITIDTARCFFKSDKRRYIIIDAPGHIEFLKNMVTGASRAEAALMVIDAARAWRKNTRRHGYFLSMLGIRQVAVLVNKMDLVGYSEEVYRSIVTEFTEFLAKINISPAAFIPVSGMEGRQHRHPQRAHAVVLRPHGARADGRLRPRAEPGKPSAAHAGAGRLQIHRGRRRAPHRGRNARGRKSPRGR